MIAPNPNSHAHREKERGEVKSEYGGIWGEEEEGGADYRGMLRPNQQDVTPHHMKKGVRWGGDWAQEVWE